MAFIRSKELLLFSAIRDFDGTEWLLISSERDLPSIKVPLHFI